MKGVKLVVLLIALCILIVIDAAPPTDTIIRTCTEVNTFAMTFDDGPRAVTAKLLDAFKAKNVKATFFMNGHAFDEHCIYDYADIVQRAFIEGHQIASHTWSHPELTIISEEEILYQMKTLETAFKKIIGAVPIYMRPPFGSTNATVEQIMFQNGYKIALWDIDTNDYRDDIRASIDVFLNETKKFPAPFSHIVLNHDRIDSTSLILAPTELDEILKNNYKVTTVGDCTGKPNKEDWYKDIGEPGQRDDTWRCTLEDMHRPPKYQEPLSSQPSPPPNPISATSSATFASSISSATFIASIFSATLIAFTFI